MLRRMDITLQELPVYPLYDEMLVNTGAGLTREQIDWLLANGTLYRNFPLLDGRPRRPAHTVEEILQGVPSRYQEMTKHEGEYCFIEYDQAYRGDCHDQTLVTIRSYSSLEILFEKEHIKNIADSESDITDPWWKWADSLPAVLANGGTLSPCGAPGKDQALF